MCKAYKRSSRGDTMRQSKFYQQRTLTHNFPVLVNFRRYLRETLKMANAEDLNRLTSCSLVLLGHIFLSLGNSRESMNMVTPAMQLASKIPDVHVQLWASAIMKGNDPTFKYKGVRLIFQICTDCVAIR